jgi:hypothetical protein
VLHESQGGFRKGRSATDQLYTLHTLASMRARRRQSTWLCFVDFEKAYDNVWREGLWYRLREVGVDGKMLRVIQQLYEDVRARYVLNNEYHTEWVEMRKGLRQGCILSPLLFNIYLNGILQRVDDAQGGVSEEYRASDETQERRAEQGRVRVASLAYADDLVLMASSGPQLQSMLGVLEEECRRWRMRVNRSKTKVLVTGAKRQRTQSTEAARARGEVVGGLRGGRPLTLRGEEVEQVSSYVYLGVVVQADLRWDKHKATVLRRATAALHRIASAGIRAQLCSIDAAVSMWTTLVRPMLEYGVAVWGCGVWPEVDRLQYTAGRIMLGVWKGTARAAVRGELGWQTMKARRDEMIVKHWTRLTPASGAEEGRYMSQVYRAERRFWSGGRQSESGVGRFAGYVRQLLRNNQLSQYWQQQDSEPQQESVLVAPGAVLARDSEAATRERLAVEHPACRLVKEWKAAAARSEQRAWGEELKGLSSLVTYRGYKLAGAGVVSARR